MNQSIGVIISIAVIALVVVLRILRMAREQRFGIVTMWIMPAIFAALAIWVMLFEHLTRAMDIVLAVVALALGGAIGWYQGTHTTVRVDRTARAMFVKISPIGAAIFFGVLAVRVAIRMASGGTFSGTATSASAVSADPGGAGAVNMISLLMLFVAVGLVAGLRAYLARAYTIALMPGVTDVTGRK